MYQILYLFRQFFDMLKKQKQEGIEKGYAPTLQRDDKAKKILKILSEHLGIDVKGKRILDIGSGNGEISLFLSDVGNQVTSVDVQQPHVELPNFILLKSAKLPFANSSFDIVIYSMVMEHLAKPSDQMLQLKEIYRVLKKDGCCYVSQPNRIFPMEVHTRIWFLHWFPDQIWFRLAKAMGRYQEDVYLHGYFKLKKMFHDAGFACDEFTAKIIADPAAYSMYMPGRDEKIKKLSGGGHTPYLLRVLQPFSPSNVFVLYKRDGIKGR